MERTPGDRRLRASLGRPDRGSPPEDALTGVLLAALLATACGALIARRIDPGAPLGRIVGEGILVGFGLAAATLLVLGLAGPYWSVAGAFTIMVAAAAAAWRRSPLRFAPPHPLDAATTVVLAAYARYATAAPPWELDFIDNWGLKARAFALHRGVDWAFLKNPDYWWSHPDYPPLVPLSFDFIALMSGGWDDRWLGALNVILAAGALLVVRSVAEEELQSRFGGAITALVMSWLFAIPWIGLADGPLVAYAVPALLLIRRGDTTPGAVLLGLAASCKNEGLTLVVAAALGMATDRELRARIARLWPAVVIPLPWLALRAMHDLATDLATGSVLQRVTEHLRDPGQYVRLLAEYAGGRPVLWSGVVLGAVIVFREWMQSERFFIVTAFAQVLFYVGAYLVTPLGVEFHIRWSWDRLVWHITAIVVIATILPLMRLLSSAAISAAAATRPGAGGPPVTSDE